MIISDGAVHDTDLARWMFDDSGGRRRGGHAASEQQGRLPSSSTTPRLRPAANPECR
jgi:predicted dehydrogenase